MRKPFLFIALIFLSVSYALACSVGGSVSGSKALCSGSTSGVLTLSGHTGTIVRWESAISPFTSWTPITNTIATYTSGTLIQTTAFRAIVQNGACAAVASDSAVVTIVTTPIKGSITASKNSCAYFMYPDEVLTLTGSTGNVLGWQYAAAPYTSWIDISANPWPPYAPITTTTATVPVYLFASGPSSSSPGIYAFRAVLACTDTVNTDSVRIHYKDPNTPASTWLGKSTDWNDYANWCGAGGVPNSGVDASISGGMLLYPAISSSAYVQTLTLDSGASLQVLSGGQINVWGNLSKHASATVTSAPLGTIHYDGPNPQTINPNISYGILKVNLAPSFVVKALGGNTSAKMVNLAGGNGVNLNYDVTIDSIMTGSGWFNMGAGHLTIKNIGTASGKPTAVFRFWECTSCDAIPVTITNTGTVDDFTVRPSYSLSSAYSGETPAGSAITAHASEKVWFISEAVPGGSNATITLDPGPFSWLGPGSFAVSNKALARWNGSYWVASSFVNSPFSDEATNSGITWFGPFIIMDTAANTLLPVELLSLNALMNRNDVEVSWKTASETNNAGFEVQRSLDNKDFTAVGTMKGAGNSNRVLTYTFTDMDAAGLVKQNSVVYYRIKQTDFDGKSSISPGVPVSAKGKVGFAPVSAPENPVSGAAHITYTTSVEQPVSVHISDDFGKTVYEGSTLPQAGLNTLTLDAFENLGSGLYVVVLSQDEIIHTFKLIRR